MAGADFAKGTRFAAGGGSADITRCAASATQFLNGVFNTGFRTRYSDLCYGYNAFWADLIPLLDLPDHTGPAPDNGKMLWGDGFEIETVINCRFAAAQVSITEVPSSRSCGCRRVQPPRRPGRHPGAPHAVHRVASGPVHAPDGAQSVRAGGRQARAGQPPRRRLTGPTPPRARALTGTCKHRANRP